MELIDGIGVDVITISLIIFTIIIIILSWLSTNVRHFPFPANLLVIERRSRRLYTTNNQNGNINLVQSQNQANNNLNSQNEVSSTLTVNGNSENLTTIIEHNREQANIMRNNNLELVNEIVEQALVENVLDGNIYPGQNINLLTSNNNFSTSLNGASAGINSGNGQASSSMHSNNTRLNRTNVLDTESEIRSNQTDESINILIKFVNEKEMRIQAKPSDTILILKKAHFSSELSNNKIVRFIYQGQFLADKNTIKSYNIKDQTTIHCHITAKSTTDNQNSNQTDQETNGLRHHVEPSQSNVIITDTSNEIQNNQQQTYTTVINIDLNHLLLPFLAIILGTCWYFRIHFKHLFSPLSTLILIIFTFLYAIFFINNLQSASTVAVNNIMVHRRVLHMREETPQQNS